MLIENPDTESTREKWLAEGYREFAEYGPDNLSINRISKFLGSSRASFYHHFGDADMFIDDLLARHWEISSQFNTTGKIKCQRLYPDLYDLLSEYPIPLKFSLQLFHHRHIPRFNMLFNRTYTSSAKAFCLKLLARHLNLNLSSAAVFDLWVAMGEAWYSRINPEDLSAPTLQRHSEEIIQTITELLNSQLYVTLHENP